MEIITAGDGTAHVSSADDGAIYAGIVGPECYVTSIGDKLSCTMQSANKALIGTGVGVMYGRMLRVTVPEEVSIDSGTQAQRRNDIICAHFSTSSEGHESGDIVVLKGTPTSGQEAEDPEIPDGDILDGATEAYMPLWRIPIDGISVGDPESMFDVLLPMSELQSDMDALRESLSRIESDGWTVQRIGDIAICFTVEHFTGLSPVEKTGFSQTLKYGQVDLRTKPPVAFSPSPAISVSMSARDGFTASTNYDGATDEIAFSLALMNLSATDVYVRIIAIGKVS